MKAAKAMILMCLAVAAPACAESENAAASKATQSTTSPATVRARSSASSGLGSTSPVLREAIVKESAPATEVGNVESFFQIELKKRNNPQGLLMQPAAAASPAKKRQSLVYGLYRGAWHALDNAGLPMFFGMDSCIDPSIKQIYLIPSPKLPRERAVVKELEKSIGASVNQDASQAPPVTVQSIPQKIPQNELEGVALPTPREDVHAPSP